MAYYVKAETIGEAWPRVLRAIWSKGDLLSKEEWGEDTKEILNLVISISAPEKEPVIPQGYPWSAERLEEYAKKEFLSTENPGFAYTYGERLLNYEGVNQLERVIERLKGSPKTRRSVAVSWMPKRDFDNKEVPCLVLWDWKVRDGCLHQSTVIRSNDMYGAWPANAFGLLRLQQHVASRLGVKTGGITTHSLSAHIYSHDWENVQKLIG